MQRRHANKYGRLAIYTVISAAVLCGVLFSVSGRVFAACPTGQAATNAGTCCPFDQLVIDAAGDRSCPSPSGPDCQHSGKQNGVQCIFSQYLSPLVALLSASVGIVVTATIIYGAVEVTSSGGDPQRLTSGKNHIRNALIGLASYLVLFAFLQFIIPGGLL